MRALVTIAVAAFVAAVPAAAQDQPAAGKAPADQSEAKGTDAKKAKPAEKKICKRLSSGRVCMTEQKWRQYELMM